MKRTIKVFLGEDSVPLGLLRYDLQGGRESAAFEYDASWLERKDAFAIDPALRLIAGPQFHAKGKSGSVFHGAIADTEPDGWGKRVIFRDFTKQRKEARDEGRPFPKERLNDLDYLLAVDDQSRSGALRFQDEDGGFQRAAEQGRRTTPPLIELGALLSATRNVETNTETAADLAYLRGRGTSLGGLRPKCSIIDDDGQLSIGKFPSVRDERAVTKAEVLALTLARGAGIDVADARLIESDGVPVALIRRFDREEGRRLMYVSAATLMEVERTDSGEHTYTEIMDTMRKHGAEVQRDAEELWRRIAYSILITNVDDHLLNHGFLHVDRGQWRLSPAFDLNPNPDHIRELKTWVSEETGPEATIAALMSVVPYFRLARARAKAILGEVEAAVSQWRKQGRAIGMTDADLDQFADAFEHPERAAARRASATSA